MSDAIFTRSSQLFKFEGGLVSFFSRVIRKERPDEKNSYYRQVKFTAGCKRFLENDH